MFRTVLVSLVTLLVVSAHAPAQPLADRIPADAVVYVGWAGADSMGPGFEGSHLKAMLDSAEMARVVGEVLPQLAARAGEMQGAPPVPPEILSGVLAPMWRHPTAVYVGPVDLTNLDRPQPRFAVICDAGEEAGELRQRLQDLVKGAGQNAPVPVAVRGAGNVVALVVGKVPELEGLLAGKGKGKSIGSVKSFATAMAVQKSPVLAGYVDAEAIVRMVDQVAPRDGDMKEQWPGARDALGLAGLKRVSFSAGFDGKDWATHAFIEAPGPREGLLAMLEAEPVSDDALRAIPSTATMAGVTRLDLGGVFDAVRGALQKFDPDSAREMDEVVGHVNGAMSLDLRQDILGPLGDE